MIPRPKPLKHVPVRKKRPGPPRKGRIVDQKYYDWLHTQPGVVLGGRCHSVHHIRFMGSPKSDRRAIPLEFGYHQNQEGKQSIESMGKSKWQEWHEVDIEEEIERLQAKYLSEHPGVKW